MYSRIRKTFEEITSKYGSSHIHIFNHNEANISNYSRTIQKTADFVAAHLRSTGKPFSGITPAKLAPTVNSINLDKPLENLDDVLSEVKEIYTQHAIAFHLPTYIAHLNCPILTPTLAAEVLISSLNSSLDTWDQSAGGTLMEMKLINWTCNELGLGDNSDGVFTSGGTQSNLMGLLMARDHYIITKLGHDVKKDGLPEAAKRFRIFCSERSHFSIKKAASIMGLGEHAVIPVKTDKLFKMDVTELENLIDRETKAGNLPIAIVGTGGTTDLSSIDPLETLAGIAKKHNSWFHVDAAYGCGLMLSDAYKHLLNGVEQADSVTVDYHKAFFQPVSSSGLLVKNKETLRLMCYHADYLNPVEMDKDGVPNQVNKTIQTTRRFDALKLWFTLRTMGRETLGGYIEQIIALAQNTADVLENDPDFELLNYPEISTILYRYKPYPANTSTLNTLNLYIRKKLMESGKALVASTKIEGEVYLKFTILNPVTTIDDIKYILDLIKQIGNDYAKNN